MNTYFNRIQQETVADLLGLILISTVLNNVLKILKCVIIMYIFSGLMYSKDYSLQSVPEIVAHSGFALLHFYSDIAYNLSGFNISYRYV